MKQFEVILFDLGGVLVELTGVPTLHEWTENKLNDNELRNLWITSPTVRAFETGRMTTEQFGAEIVKEMQLPVSGDTFIKAFSQWPSGLFPGVPDLISCLKENYTLACLSNSNELHWDRIMEEMAIEDLLDHHFASHLMGKIKPDMDGFDHVLESLNCKASDVLFVDDNEVNVIAGRKMGMRAHQVRGTTETQHLFEEIGVLENGLRMPK